MAVARHSRLIVGAQVMLERNWERMQGFADRLPAASWYCSDEWNMYQSLLWPDHSEHVISHGKEETYTIEGINADLRTYLGRLKRESRCFSRSLEALTQAVRMFVWYYNRRQRLLLTSPNLKSKLPLLF
jgi:insertion element IS1 protein InsB